MYSEEEKQNRYHKLLILAILLIGLLIRTFRINKECLSMMEHFNIYASESIFTLDREINVLMSAHQPIYHLILLFLSKFVSNDITLRYISVLFGVGAIFMIYKFASELLKPKLALLAMLLASVNPMLIYYSRDIQTYSLFCFLIVLDTWLYWQAFINGRSNYTSGYIIISIISYFTHYFTVIVIAAHFITLLFLYLSERKSKKYLAELTFFLKKISILFILAAFYLPVTLNALYCIAHHGKGKFYYMPPRFASEVIFHLFRILIGIPKGFGLLVLLFFILLIFALHYIKKTNKKLSFFMLGLFFVSLFAEINFLTFLIIKADGVYLNARHFIFLVPFLIIIFCYFLQLLMEEKTRLIYLASFLFIFLLGLNFIFSFDILTRRQKPNHYDAFKYLKSEVKELTALKFPIIFFNPVFLYYLDFPELYELKNNFYINFRNIDECIIKNSVQLLYKKKGIKNLCLVDIREKIFGFPHSNFIKQDYIIMQLKKQFRLLKEKKFDYLAVYLFELN